MSGELYSDRLFHIENLQWADRTVQLARVGCSAFGQFASRDSATGRVAFIVAR